MTYRRKEIYGNSGILAGETLNGQVQGPGEEINLKDRKGQTKCLTKTSQIL